jgi:DNA-binding response OmpR family regulator
MSSVLVVEEDRDVRELVEVSLRRVGLTPVLADGAGAAAHALAAVRPSALVVGLPVSELQPPEVLRALRRATQAPLVVLSPRPPGQQVLESPTITYLPKPFSPRQLGRLLTDGRTPDAILHHADRR